MSVPVTRAYSDSRFGQSHLYRADPAHGGTALPLVCFHMGPWSAAYLEPFLGEMGTDRPALAIDTPGYGNSDPPPALPSMQDYAGSMADTLDALGITRCDLFGDRTGAKIALELARQRPDLVRRMVLVSPVIWTEGEQVFRENFPLEEVNEDGSHAAAQWALSVNLAMPGRSLNRLAEVFHTRILHLDIAHYSRRAAAIHDAAAILRSWPGPILALDPDDDLSGMAQRVAPLLQHPDSRVQTLPDWGYGFIEIKAQEAAALIRGFLDTPAGVP